MHMQILLIICHDFLSDNVIWVNNIGECVNHKYGSSFCNTQLKNRITDDRVIFKKHHRKRIPMPLKISLIFSNFFFTYESSINIFWKIEFDIKLVEMTTSRARRPRQLLHRTIKIDEGHLKDDVLCKLWWVILTAK